MRGVPGDAWRQLARAASGQATALHGWAPDALLFEAARQGLIPLLDQRLHEGSLAGCSAMQREQLAAATRGHVAADLARGAAEAGFIELLVREGHDLLLLKGAALARLHYPRSYLRPRCDTDVYIRAADRAPVDALLAAHGYTLVRHDDRPLTSGQFQAARETFQGERLWFDIHVLPSNRAVFRHCLPFDDCLAAAQTVPGLPQGARAPGDRELLLHASLHRLGHGRGTERNRLIWLYDIHLLTGALGDVAARDFADRALELGVGVICAAAIAAAQDAFATPLPPDLLTRLHSRAVAEPSARLVEAGKLAWLWSDLRLQPDWRTRRQFIGEVLHNRLRRA